MKRLSRTAAGVAAVSTALALTACGSSGSSTTTSSSTPAASGSSSVAPASKVTIAGVYGNAQDPFWASIGCGAQKAAAELGVQYKAFTSANLETSAFSQNFSTALLAKPSGIFVNPSNPNQFVTQYQQLMSKGVPVVTINGSTPAAQLKVVGTDTKDLSFVQSVVDLVPQDSSGKLAVVDGIPGLVPVETRLKPVVDAITSGRTGLKTLPTVYSGFDVNKATSAVSSLLIAHPDLKVIVAADGPDGTAAAAAVKSANKVGKVTVISLDATPPQVAALKSGVITGLVAQAPAQIGAQQVKTLVDYIKANPGGGAVTASSDLVGVPQKLLTKDNVDSPENSDWVYKTSC
jgi:ribose transport system substrate-binding protein